MYLLDGNNDIPDPPELTEEVLKKIRQEVKEWNEWFKKETADMEILSPEEWKIIIK